MDVVVAAISAGIALAALMVSFVVARRQTAIQERVAAIEEARRTEEVEARTLARVTATVRGHLEPWLVLRNEGQALARGVDVAVGPLGGQQMAPSVEGLEVLPVDLQPGQEMRCSIVVQFSDQEALQATVRWADGAGDHKELFVLQVL